MEPTLDQIKEYVLSNGISLEEKSNNEKLLDVFEKTNNLKYYEYYLNHSNEINDWLLNTDEYDL